MGNHIRWTKGEVKFLVDNYNNMSRLEIARYQDAGLLFMECKYNKFVANNLLKG